jgi:hypothetical protein
MFVLAMLQRKAYSISAVAMFSLVMRRDKMHEIVSILLWKSTEEVARWARSALLR